MSDREQPSLISGDRVETALPFFHADTVPERRPDVKTPDHPPGVWRPHSSYPVEMDARRQGGGLDEGVDDEGGEHRQQDSAFDPVDTPAGEGEGSGDEDHTDHDRQQRDTDGG